MLYRFRGRPGSNSSDFSGGGGGSDDCSDVTYVCTQKER